MQILLWGIAAIALAIALVVLTGQDPGYVLISYANTSVEMSLWFAVCAIMIFCALFYFALRALSSFQHAGKNMRRWWHSRSFRREESSTCDGIAALLEGDWLQAARQLRKKTRDPRQRMVRCILAAHAYAELEQWKNSERLLAIAEQSADTTNVAVLLARAAVQRRHGQRELCLATLVQAYQTAPQNPMVITQLIDLYEELGDWEYLAKMAPAAEHLGAEHGQRSYRRRTARALFARLSGGADGRPLLYAWGGNDQRQAGADKMHWGLNRMLPGDAQKSSSGLPATRTPAAAGTGAPGTGAPGTGAPGIGAPGTGAPGIGAPEERQLGELAGQHTAGQHSGVMGTKKGAAQDAKKALARLHKQWAYYPTDVTEAAEVLASYVYALQYNGAAEEAEQLLRKQLRKRWDPRLVRLYGIIRSPSPQEQMDTAEGWLKKHPHDPDLLLTLGRIALVNHLWNKARQYFQKSLQRRETPEIYAEIGRLLAHMEQPEAGMKYFRRGLLLSLPALPEAPLPASAAEQNPPREA